LERPGYLEEFTHFWSSRQETRRIWFSVFTPQKGAVSPEVLSPAQRRQVIHELTRLRIRYPLVNMSQSMIVELAHPPASPNECIFARTTTVISADLKTRVTPCQFGGDPDCSQCGCIATMGLAALGHHKILPGITAGSFLALSELIGRAAAKLRSGFEEETVEDDEPTSVTSAA
jgi:hypothetical protein